MGGGQASYLLRLDLIDLATLPIGTKISEAQIISFVQHLTREKWSATYPSIELKPLHLDAHGGSFRAALPLMLTLDEFLTLSDKPGGEALPLLSAHKRAFWNRFTAELFHLQESGLIRDAVRLPDEPGTDSGDENRGGRITESMMNKCQLELRYVILLLWLQAFRSKLNVSPSARTTAMNAVNAEVSPRSIRSLSLSAALSPSRSSALLSVADVRDSHGSHTGPLTLSSFSPSLPSFSGLTSMAPLVPVAVQCSRSSPARSPRTQYLSDPLGQAGAFSNPGGSPLTLEELNSFVKQQVLDALPVVFSLIGFHFDVALKHVESLSQDSHDFFASVGHIAGHIPAANLTASATAIGGVSGGIGRTGPKLILTQTTACVSAHHLKYLALLLQLRKADSHIAGRRRASSVSLTKINDTDTNLPTSSSASASASSAAPRRLPCSSRIFENFLFEAVSASGLCTESAFAPMVSIADLSCWCRGNLNLCISVADLMVNSTIHPSGGIASQHLLNHFTRSPGGGGGGAASTARGGGGCSGGSGSGGGSKDSGGSKDGGCGSEAGMGGVLSNLKSASADLTIIHGRKGECIPIPEDFKAGPINRQDLIVIDCTDLIVHVLAPFRSVRICSSRNCTIVCPCVQASAAVQDCRNVKLHLTGFAVVVSNSYNVSVNSMTVLPPVVAGDTREISLGPYDVVYNRQQVLYRQLPFRPSAALATTFTQAIILTVNSVWKNLVASTPRRVKSESFRRVQSEAAQTRPATAGGDVVTSPAVRSVGSSIYTGDQGGRPDSLHLDLDEAVLPFLQRPSDFQLLFLSPSDGIQDEGMDGSAKQSINASINASIDEDNETNSPSSPSSPSSYERGSLLIPEIYSKALEERQALRLQALEHLHEITQGLSDDTEAEFFNKKLESIFMEYLQRAAPKEHRALALISNRYNHLASSPHARPLTTARHF